MNSISDSGATYCSEVEELIKLTSELNSHSSNLPVRRSQRLSQKRLASRTISENNVSILTCDKVLEKALPEESLNIDVPQKTTQDVFSIQDLREAWDLPFNTLTCRQNKVIVSDSEKDLPLNLSIKNKGFRNEIIFSQDLKDNQNLPLANLNSKQARVATVNENVNNISATIPTIPKTDIFSEACKERAHLDSSLKSKLSQQETSVPDLKENNFADENVKQYLSCASIKDDIALQNVSVQDFQLKQSIQNFNNEPKLQPKLTPKKKTRRIRKKPNTDKQTNLKRIKSLTNNKKLNMNFLNVNTIPHELDTISGKNATAKNTQNLLTKSILPDVYPSHFKYQLPPEAVLYRPLVPYPTIVTPENTPSYELCDSSSTSPSLPDSLRGIFDTDDIKEILNIEKVSYRLYDYHVRALAVILNLRVEYLIELLDKILQMNSSVLKTFDKAIKTPFVEDRDLFQPTPEGWATNEDVVQNSQSPIQRKFLSQIK